MNTSLAIDWLYSHRRLVPETGCWEYTGDTTEPNANGRVYGRVSANSPISKFTGETLIHRISARVFAGFDGDRRKQLIHTCDNGICFNYEHLARKAIAERTCKDCGVTFPLTHEFFYGSKKSGLTFPFLPYCIECMKARIKASLHKRMTRDPEGYRAARRAAKKNREAAKKCGVWPYRVNYDFILERDGLVCHICKRPIESMADLHFDHIVPLSKGGVHANWNVACSHAACNMRKAAKVLPEPPRQLSYI